MTGNRFRRNDIAFFVYRNFNLNRSAGANGTRRRRINRFDEIDCLTVWNCRPELRTKAPTIPTAELEPVKLSRCSYLIILTITYRRWNKIIDDHAVDFDGNALQQSPFKFSGSGRLVPTLAVAADDRKRHLPR